MKRIWIFFLTPIIIVYHVVFISYSRRLRFKWMNLDSFIMELECSYSVDCVVHICRKEKELLIPEAMKWQSEHLIAGRGIIKSSANELEYWTFNFILLLPSPWIMIFEMTWIFQSRKNMNERENVIENMLIMDGEIHVICGTWGNDKKRIFRKY